MINAESTQMLLDQDQIDLHQDKSQPSLMKSPGLQSQRMPSKIDMSSLLPSMFKITKKTSPKMNFSPKNSRNIIVGGTMTINKRSMTSIQRTTNHSNSKGTIPAFRGVAVRSALESPPLTKSDFKSNDSKMKSSRFERKIKMNFEDTTT